MKKVFLTLIIGLIVATVASYFGLQWKVQKSVDDFFAALPFIDSNYSKATVELDGRLVVNNIDLFIPMSQTSVSIDSIAIETGGLLNSLKLEKDLESGKLPDQLKLSIKAFSTDISSSFVSDADDSFESGPFSQILAFGCGRFTSIGPQELYDMGMRNLTFDLDIGYEYQYMTDTMTSSMDFYFDGIANVVMNQTIIGIGPLMENYKTAFMSFNPDKISTSEIQLQYVDLGFNAKQGDYCARASGLDKKEWHELNVSMFAKVLEAIDFESNVDALRLYSEVSSERARIDLRLRPIAGFTAADFQMYQISDLVELLNLRLTVNDKSVEIDNLNWDQKKWRNVDLSSIRKAFKVGGGDETETAETEEPKRLERILRAVPLAELEKYLHRNVQVTRRDGKRFSGKMTQVSAERIVVRTRFSSGYTDLPLQRPQIKEVKVYPEE